jgi:hypothetical protein
VVAWRGGDLAERLESRLNTGLAAFHHRFQKCPQKCPVNFFEIFLKKLLTSEIR